MSSNSAGIGGGLPPQTSDLANYVLATDGQNAFWEAVAGATITVGTFGSTPTANGATASGSTLTLQPADGTHPGSLTTAAQTLAGVKTFSSVPVAAGLTAPASTALTYTSNVADGAGAVCHVLDTGALVSTSGCKWLSIKTNGSEQYFFGVVGGVNTFSAPGQIKSGTFRLTNGSGYLLQEAAASPLYLYGNATDGATHFNVQVDGQATLSTAGAAALVVANNGTKVSAIETNGTVWGIYFKSPDGTAYLATIANGGTWSIAAAP